MVKKMRAEPNTLKSQSESRIDFCFINDGSMDLTGSELRKCAAGPHVSHDVILGVSAALLTGFKIGMRLDYDYLIQCDSDGQHPVEHIPFLIDQAGKGEADLLIGSRFNKVTGSPDASNPAGNDKSTTFCRRIGMFIITDILQLFKVRTVITDPTSGFRVYSKEAVGLLMRMMPDEYPEPESIALLALMNKKIKEVPITMNARSSGASSLNGTRGVIYMAKVVSALIGLRLRFMLLKPER